MRWAITPRGVGRDVGYREIVSDDDLLAGEFASSTDPAGMVLANDETSLRAPTNSELLTRAKEAQLEYIKNRRNEAIEEGLTFNGRPYWTDRDSVIDLATALIGFLSLSMLSNEQVSQLPIPPAIPWKTREGYVPHSPQELVLLYAAVSQYRLAQHQVEEQLIARINAATTIEQVSAVDWPS